MLVSSLEHVWPRLVRICCLGMPLTYFPLTNPRFSVIKANKEGEGFKHDYFTITFSKYGISIMSKSSV